MDIRLPIGVLFLSFSSVEGINYGILGDCVNPMFDCVRCGVLSQRQVHPN